MLTGWGNSHSRFQSSQSRQNLATEEDRGLAWSAHADHKASLLVNKEKNGDVNKKIRTHLVVREFKIKNSAPAAQQHPCQTRDWHWCQILLGKESEKSIVEDIRAVSTVLWFENAEFRACGTAEKDQTIYLNCDWNWCQISFNTYREQGSILKKFRGVLREQ